MQTELIVTKKPILGNIGELVSGNLGGFPPQRRYSPGPYTYHEDYDQGNVLDDRIAADKQLIQANKTQDVISIQKMSEISFPFRKKIRKKLRKHTLTEKDIRLAKSIIGICKDEIEPDSSLRFREYLRKNAE